MPEIGLEGQKKLLGASVLVVGAGGLGCPALMYLTGAGVGKIGIADFDSVSEPDLHRQLLYGQSDIGKNKTFVAYQNLKHNNPDVEIVTFEDKVTLENAISLITGFDIVLDCTDNFPTRYLLNDACFFAGVPLVYGSVYRFEGQVSVFNYNGSSCYRCLYPAPPPDGAIVSCAEAGVLGVLPGLVGTMQATETIKIILGIGEVLADSLLLIDSLSNEQRKIKVNKNADCNLCGDNPEIKELIDYEEFCGIAEETETELEITTLQLKEELDNGAELTIVDVREKFEWDICNIAGATLIPMQQIPGKIDELKAHDKIIFYCHTGVRSLAVAQYLHSMGMTSALSLAGGIDEWSEKIDPSVPKY